MYLRPGWIVGAYVAVMVLVAAGVGRRLWFPRSGWDADGDWHALAATILLTFLCRSPGRWQPAPHPMTSPASTGSLRMAGAEGRCLLLVDGITQPAVTDPDAAYVAA